MNKKKTWFLDPRVSTKNNYQKKKKSVMPKVARKESSKPRTSASALEEQNVQKKKTRRSKPGSRSKKEIKHWEAVSADKLPIRFQRVARITREILEAEVMPLYSSDLEGKVPMFRVEFMRAMHDFLVRRMIKETKLALRLSCHTHRTTLMHKDWKLVQQLLAEMH